MLSGKAEQSHIVAFASIDITQEPNSVVLALVWGLLVLVLGCYLGIFASNLTLRLIGVVLIASSSIPFLVFRKIMKRQGFAPAKKNEPWPAFDWDSLWDSVRQPPSIRWSSLDRVQKIGFTFAVTVMVVSVVFLVYVWLTYGF